AAGSNPAPATKPSSLKISNYLLIAGGKASLSLAMVAPRPADHNLKAAGSNPAPATKPSSLKISNYLLIAGAKTSSSGP
ncbi:hypothetical protein ACCS84_28620, partial [Rhizobium ruizarguesonis]